MFFFFGAISYSEHLFLFFHQVKNLVVLWGLLWSLGIDPNMTSDGLREFIA